MNRLEILNDYLMEDRKTFTSPTFSMVKAATRWLRYGYDMSELRKAIGITDRIEEIAEQCRRVA